MAGNQGRTDTHTHGFPPELAADMRGKGIDLGLTRTILTRYNEGFYDHVEPIKVNGLPEVDGKTVIDVTGDLRRSYPLAAAARNIARLDPDIDLQSIGEVAGGEIRFDRASLTELGVRLYPYAAYGILNGGSASSYVDQKKNMAFNADLFDICRPYFDNLAGMSKGRAKGLTPAFVNPDGTPGPSFIELKMRSLLIEALRFQARRPGNGKDEPLPCFQMTSVYNDEEIGAAYREYRQSDLLRDLIEATGLDVTKARTGIQPMLAAYTHSSLGRPKEVFTKAYGKEGSTLPMPGGHGQNFAVLREVYRDLQRQGYKYVYLGNVDNLGYTVDPACLALLAIEGKQAAFEFAFRTVVDVKGGILVVDQRDRLNCADIGPAVSKEEVLRAEQSGKRILFNCAIGLFDLDYLVDNIDHIVDHLPMRFTDQDKDAGRYSQAEQVTWEIIGMLTDFLILGVDKYDRFLAAKMLLEGLMTSGINLDHPRYPTDPDPAKDLCGIAGKLHAGLVRKLETVYGMKREGARWVPKSIAELQAEFGG